MRMDHGTTRHGDHTPWLRINHPPAAQKLQQLPALHRFMRVLQCEIRPTPGENAASELSHQLHNVLQIGHNLWRRWHDKIGLDVGARVVPEWGDEDMGVCGAETGRRAGRVDVERAG